MTLEQIQTKLSSDAHLDETVYVVFDGRIVGVMSPRSWVTDVEREEMPDDVLAGMANMESAKILQEKLWSFSLSWTS